MRGFCVFLLYILFFIYAEAEEIHLPEGDVFYKKAFISSLNKITTRKFQSLLDIDKPVYFGNLLITMNGCWIGNTGALKSEESRAFITIWESKAMEVPIKIFEGWMWSSSPELAILEHPVYEVVLLRCETS